jgi:hypothetical protein
VILREFRRNVEAVVRAMLADYLPLTGGTITGDVKIDGGVNVGTATGAAAGEIRASGGLYLDNQNTVSYRQHIISALADEASARIHPTLTGYSFFVVYNSSNGTAAAFVRSGGSIAKLGGDASFVTTDTDNKACVLVDGSSNTVVKNRLGGPRNFRIHLFN